MINFFICLIISVLVGYGFAIALVEKGKEWPIRPWRIRLQLLLRKIYWKLPQMLFCVTCTSFWTTLLADTILSILCFFLTGGFYFFWPFSGFISVGLSWTIIEFLDKENKINLSFGGDDNANV